MLERVNEIADEIMFLFEENINYLGNGDNLPFNIKFLEIQKKRQPYLGDNKPEQCSRCAY